MRLTALNRLHHTKIMKLGDGLWADGGGLYLRVSGASRSFVFRFTWDKKRSDIGIGSAAAISLTEARDRAEKYRAMLANGQDPRSAGTARRPAAPSPTAARVIVPTFADAMERFFAHHGESWTNKKHRLQWRSTLEMYAGALMRRSVDSITEADVIAVLDPIWMEKPETSRRVRGRLEKVLGFAIARKWRSGPNPAVWRGGLEYAFPGGRPAPRHFKAVPVVDAPAAYAALAAMGSQGAAAMRAVMLTACRSGEVRHLAWSDIDRETSTIVIKPERMKARREHRVPVPVPLADLLDAQPRFLNTDLVFASSRMGPVSDMTLTAALRRAGLAVFTAHGMRSTFADWASGAGYGRELIEDQLAHLIGSAVERAYRRTDFLEGRRAMMDEWARFLVPPVAGNRATTSRMH